MRLGTRSLRGASLAAALVVALAACNAAPKRRPPPAGRQTTTTTSPHAAATTTTTTKTAPTRNVASFAEAPGQRPSYIAPITPVGYATTANVAQFSSLMWRPLVWPGTGEALGPNKAKSLYSSIDYNSNDTAVTIKLKDWSWSDGTPVTARDITFFLNLVAANKHQWSGWVSGQLPDNIAGAKVTGPKTLVLKLKGSWSPFWFTDNELSLVTPLPQQRWDKTLLKSKDANYDQTPAGARAVWSFLTSQAKQASTFATNPLWKVVDGPWALQSFDATGASAGRALFVPNAAYSGSDQPALAGFAELPFASTTAEVDALASGDVDVGYLPSSLLADRPVLAKAGYSLTAWVGLGMAGLIPNLTSAKVGPILAQAYVRQALQQMVDQPDMVGSIYSGFASPTYGPVPLAPPNAYASPAEAANPYPFNLTGAATLLAKHGWQFGAAGQPDVCADPKSCGKGIAKGRALVLSLTYPTGNPALATEVEVFKSAAIQAGVVINLRAVSPSAFASTVKPCTTSCGWELATYAGYPFRVLPTGEGLFVKGSPLDIGGFNDTTNAANVAATIHRNSPSAFYSYEDYLARQVPWIWLPSPDYHLTEVTSSLEGVTPQSVYRYLNPEDWSYSP
ncbi:MAG: ABC transporter substrate-binding protein [Acidimicrobiales bacterium]